jgi:hypothetical protein
MNATLSEALRELRRQWELFSEAISALEKLESLAPVAGGAAERTKRATPTKTGDAKAPRVKPGSVYAFVRAVSAKTSGPFNVRDLTEQVSDRMGKSVTATAVRSAVALLVNTGELKVAHEGTGRMDPTTWQATDKARKGHAKDGIEVQP